MRPPTVAFAGALDTTEGGALASEVIEMLEAELVRFRHRVTHDYSISLDRARAALVLLGKLVAAGVPWTARTDSAPRRIFDAFIELATRAESTWPRGLAEAIHADLAEFINVTSKVTIASEPAMPPIAELMRLGGAAPEAWWWSAQFADDRTACWAAATTSERVVLVALAFGASSEQICRALATAFAVAATRAKTRRPAQRTELVALLERIASSGAAALASDKDLIARITAFTFELAAARSDDGLAEIATVSFQLIELLRAADRAADPERFGDVAVRAQRTLSALGVQLVGFLRRDLESRIAIAK
ncbi:MAG: hypothetical protein JWO36_7356 [Myxococcales bacterium]|nr:hypothetical protein [Myxococcales bacterium]